MNGISLCADDERHNLTLSKKKGLRKNIFLSCYRKAGAFGLFPAQFIEPALMSETLAVGMEKSNF